MCIRDSINIVTKEDKPGIDIYIAPGTKNESVHIPVLISQTGLKDMVYNDFFIGEDCDVTIVAGCGLHNCGTQESRHDGIHSFFVGKNARVRYIETVSYTHLISSRSPRSFPRSCAMRSCPVMRPETLMLRPKKSFSIA